MSRLAKPPGHLVVSTAPIRRIGGLTTNALRITEGFGVGFRQAGDERADRSLSLATPSASGDRGGVAGVDDHRVGAARVLLGFLAALTSATALSPWGVTPHLGEPWRPSRRWSREIASEVGLSLSSFVVRFERTIRPPWMTARIADWSVKTSVG